MRVFSPVSPHPTLSQRERAKTDRYRSSMSYCVFPANDASRMAIASIESRRTRLASG